MRNAIVFEVRRLAHWGLERDSKDTEAFKMHYRGLNDRTSTNIRINCYELMSK